MSDLDGVLARLAEVNALLAGIPEGAEIFEKVQAGTITTEAATLQLMDLAAKHGLLEHLIRQSEEIKSLVPSFQGEATKLSDVERPLVMKTSTGITQLNPLFEASLLERAFFDGDVPEFRDGRMAEGVMPAVPVVTDSLDSIEVGLMLETASAEVAEEIRQAIVQRDEVVERLLEIAEGKGELALKITKRNLPFVPTGVKGYEAGRTPMMRRVAAPTMEQIAALTAEDQIRLVFKSVTTTQGRVSLAPAIEKALRRRIEEHVPLNPSGYPQNGEESLECEWAAEVFGKEISADYAPAESAVALFAAKIRQAIAEGYKVPEDGLCVKVVPLNMIAERRFGWCVRFGPPTKKV